MPRNNENSLLRVRQHISIGPHNIYIYIYYCICAELGLLMNLFTAHRVCRPYLHIHEQHAFVSCFIDSCLITADACMWFHCSSHCVCSTLLVIDDRLHALFARNDVTV